VSADQPEDEHGFICPIRCARLEPASDLQAFCINPVVQTLLNPFRRQNIAHPTLVIKHDGVRCRKYDAQPTRTHAQKEERGRLACRRHVGSSPSRRHSTGPSNRLCGTMASVLNLSAQPVIPIVHQQMTQTECRTLTSTTLSMVTNCENTSQLLLFCTL